MLPTHYNGRTDTGATQSVYLDIGLTLGKLDRNDKSWIYAANVACKRMKKKVVIRPFNMMLHFVFSVRVKKLHIYASSRTDFKSCLHLYHLFGVSRKRENVCGSRKFSISFL